MTIVPVPTAAPLTVADKKGKEPATFARTLGIMRLIAPTKKKNIQRALKDIKDTKDIQKTKQSPKGNRTVIVITAAKQDIGLLNAPLRTFHHSIRNFGKT